MKKALLHIYIIVFSLAALNATASNSVRQITSFNKIPVSKITDVFFGNKGLMWIGSDNGLFYYDGYSYGSVGSSFLGNKGLADDYIYKIDQDNQGNIWVLTNYGVEKIEVGTRKAVPYLYLENASNVTALKYIADYQAILIASTAQIIKLDINSGIIDTVFTASSSLSSPVLNRNVLCFFDGNTLFNVSLSDSSFKSREQKQFENLRQVQLSVCDSNHTFFTIANKLYHFNSNSGDVVLTATFNSPIIHLSNIVNNHLAVQTVNQLFYGGIDEIEQWSINPVSIFEDDVVTKLILDKTAIPWVTTQSDIYKVNPYAETFRHSTELHQQIEYAEESPIVFETNRKGLVFQHRDGGLFYYSAQEKRNIYIPIKKCNSVAQGENGLLYLADDQKLYEYDHKLNELRSLKDSIRVYNLRFIDETLWIASNKGVYISEDNKLSQLCPDYTKDLFVINDLVYTINNDGFGSLNRNDCEYNLLISSEGFSKSNVLNDVLYAYDGKLWIATDNGIYLFRHDTIASIEDKFQQYYEGLVYGMIEAKLSTEIWFSTNKGIGVIDYSTGKKLLFGEDDGVELSSFYNKGVYRESDSVIVFVAGKKSLHINTAEIYRRTVKPNVFLSKVRFYGAHQIAESLLYSSDTMMVLPETRYFEIDLATTDYFASENTIFHYSLEQVNSPDRWKTLNDGNTLSVGRLSPGKYRLLLKATNNHGLDSEIEKELLVIVKAPILQTKGAYLFYIISIALLVVLLIRIRTRNLMRINREYREKEVIARKIVAQKEELTIKNKNITDSINYARRIQLAMMPSFKQFTGLFPDSFVLHMPKDIVSGDFYWVNQVHDKTFFSAVDCTGHGVPGAFMSIIGVELFRRITEIEKTSTPAEVLNSLSRNFERVFGDVDEMKLRDGMDLAFCTINKDHTLLEFAGAFNPLYIIRDSSIMEIKGDRHSVGVYEDDDLVRSFNNHVIPLKEGDTIYIFTDGFADQFGGPEGKKYKYRRFRHLLLALHQLPMEKQKDFLRENIMEWKGNLDQVDDILVMGLRIHQNA